MSGRETLRPHGPRAVVGWLLLLALAAGALAWIWTGNYRWALTGLVLALVGVFVLALATRPPTRPPTS